MSLDLNKDIIEEIRSRNDIADVISSFGVQLKRAGGASFKGLCPFHQEKTPSFHVDTSRQAFHCFGCGKGGDVFRFFMEKENVDFSNAAQILAARVGVIIPEREFSGREKTVQGERERLLAVNAEFSRFFCQNLADNPQCEGAKYLKNRGITADVIYKFKIGMAPSGWTNCLEYGRKLGFTEKELITAGIVRKKEETGRLFDQFRDRVTFTIENEQGRPVGFSARTLEAKPADGRKYVNTPDTPVFHKGRLLYALPQARQGIGRFKKAILCEGQLDAIAFHRAGIDCAVAPLGTAFTPEQAKMIRRYTRSLVLAFDADSAGQKAVLRAAEILLPLSVDLRVLQIPGGKDPDEVFTHQGAEALKNVVDNAVSWLDMVRLILPERFAMATPIGRAEAAEFIANYLKLINNQVELEVYIDEVAAMLDVSVNAVKLAVERAVSNIPPPRPSAPVPPPAAAAAVPAEKRDPARRALLDLLGLSMISADLARKAGGLLEDVELEAGDPVVKALNIVIDCALNEEMKMVSSELNNLLLETPCPEISALLVEPPAFDKPELAVDEVISEIRRVRVSCRREDILNRLRSETDLEKKMDLLRELQSLPTEGIKIL